MQTVDREWKLRDEKKYISLSWVFCAYELLDSCILSPKAPPGSEHDDERLEGKKKAGVYVHFVWISLPTWNPNLKYFPFVQCPAKHKEI
jgi:hypothetical protein